MNPVAKPAGSRLLTAGAVAFAAVVASWVIYDVLSGKAGALNPVDLTVYRDGGLIVRHVTPYYDPHASAPLYDWGGYSSLQLKFTYTPFAAIAFALISFIPMKPLLALSVIVNIASLVAALWFTFRALGYADRRVRLGQVPDDRRHQDQVDLAQVDGPHHRLEQERHRRREQRGAQPVNPVLLPSEKTIPCSHHLDESCGRMTNPTPAVARKPATVMAASRNLLVSSRYGMKISGTSLIPAATPVTAPAHQRRFPFLVNSGWVRSQMIAAIKIRLTWPR